MPRDSLVCISVTLAVEDAEELLRPHIDEDFAITLADVTSWPRHQALEWIAEFLLDVYNAEVPASVTWREFEQ